jgi:microcompartment protein CcmK/EutM
MQLARVIGTVVSTVKNDSLEGRKLLIVQTVDRNLEATGKPMVAVDAIGAGRKRVFLSNEKTRRLIARSSVLLIRSST